MSLEPSSSKREREPQDPEQPPSLKRKHNPQETEQPPELKQIRSWLGSECVNSKEFSAMKTFLETCKHKMDSMKFQGEVGGLLRMYCEQGTPGGNMHIVEFLADLLLEESVDNWRTILAIIGATAVHEGVAARMVARTRVGLGVYNLHQPCSDPDWLDKSLEEKLVELVPSGAWRDVFNVIASTATVNETVAACMVDKTCIGRDVYKILCGQARA